MSRLHISLFAATARATHERSGTFFSWPGAASREFAVAVQIEAIAFSRSVKLGPATWLTVSKKTMFQPKNSARFVEEVIRLAYPDDS